jgi:hypothetical protein
MNTLALPSQWVALPCHNRATTQGRESVARTIGALFLIVSSFSATADIYQWTDKKGQTHFSESLPKDLSTAKDIHLRSESTLPGITQIEPAQYREPIYDTRTYIQNTATNADWTACANTKRRAVYLEKQHEVHRSDELNTWL